MKGLQRSMSRGAATAQEIMKSSIAISGVLDITGVAATVDAGTFVITGLPEGNLLLLGAVAYVQVDAGEDSAVIDNWAGDFGIGYVPNADVDLADPLEDAIIASTPLLAGAADKLAPTTRGASTATETGVIFNNTDGSGELNFNLLIDDNVITDAEVGQFLVSGVLHIAFIVLGDA